MVELPALIVGTNVPALTLDDALDDIRRIDSFLAYAMPLVNAAHAARQERLDIVGEKMALLEATMYNGEFNFAEYQQTGRTAPEVLSPAILRQALLDLNPPLVPQSFIDDALPIVKPEPFVKPDLVKLRKLAKFGTKVADILKAYIRDGVPKTKLVVSPVVTDVTRR